MYRFLPDRLTPRECEVLHLIAAGRTTKQIAADLGITFKTAATHRAHIMEKLDLHGVAELVRYSLRQQQLLLHTERQRREQECLAQLREREKVYRASAKRYKELVEMAKAAAWRADADGQQALYGAHTNEREALEAYVKALKAFTDMLLEERQRPNNRDRSSPRINGPRDHPPGGEVINSRYRFKAL
jgi:DNA-binding CsgD family transcriptional regulator